MSLSLQMDYDRQVLIVRLAGELDHHHAEKVRASIETELEKGEVSATWC